MIVVVIMAILVAVAVPIYSAVTSNAKKKTCTSNQREIQAQLSNASMSNIISFMAGDEYKLTSTGEANSKQADDGTWEKVTVVSGSTDQTEAIAKLFQKAPFCPIKDSVITVKIGASEITGAEESGFRITTGCTADGHENDISS